MWAVKLEHLLNARECSEARATWEHHHRRIGIKLLWAPCLCQPAWGRGRPSSGLIQLRPTGTSGTASPMLSHHIHLQLGKRLHGEGFPPTLLISQGSGQANTKWEANSVALYKVIASRLGKRKKTCEKWHLA